MFDAKPNSLPLTSNNKLDRNFPNYKSILYNVPYVEATSILIYVTVCIMPDLAYVISVLSKFMMKPRQEDSNGQHNQ